MRTHHTGWRDIRHHYEDGDPEGPPTAPWPYRCTCGAFLPLRPEDHGFDSEQQCYWEVRTCTRCTRTNIHRE